jgi:hypothetical protein
VPRLTAKTQIALRALRLIRMFRCFSSLEICCWNFKVHDTSKTSRLFRNQLDWRVWDRSRDSDAKSLARRFNAGNGQLPSLESHQRRQRIVCSCVPALKRRARLLASLPRLRSDARQFKTSAGYGITHTSY